MLEKHSRGELFLSIFLAVIIVTAAGIVIVQGDLTTYITAPMAIADSGLFVNDFSVQEFLRPNPQMFSDYLSALFLKLGLSWHTFALAAYLVQTAVFAAGIIAVSRHLCNGKNYWLMSSLVLLLSIYAISGFRIGGNLIWYVSFYYAQSGFAAGMWGFYLSLKKKWYGAFSLFAAATLLHFTAGAYCAAFVLPFFAYEVIRNKKFRQLWAALIWVGVCIGVYLLMVAAGTTGTGLLTDASFVNIHCYLRHPHHHVPTSWDSLEWLNYAAYIAGVFLVLKAVLKGDAQKKFLMALFYTTTVMTAVILCANVLFIERTPLAFIAKIQPARCVFIHRFFLAGLLAYAAVKLYDRKAYLPAASLMLAVCLPQIGLKTFSGFLTFLCGIGIVLDAWGKKSTVPVLRTLGALLCIITAIIVLWLPFGGIPDMIVIGTVVGLLMVISLGGAYAETSGFGRRAAAIAAVLLVGASTYLLPLVDVAGRFEQITLRPVSSRYQSGLSGSVIDIAKQFKEKTDRDALFLGNPYDLDTSVFRLYSERSSVIAFKNMPFTDEGMLEWVSRLERMGAVSKGPDGRFISHERALPRMAPEDVLEYAGSYGAGYLLLTYDQEKIDRYVELGCSVFLTNDFWAVLKLS